MLWKVFISFEEPQMIQTQPLQVLHHDDGIDWLRYTATAFMTLLIVIGWIIILFRWIFTIYYFPCKYKLPDQGYFHVEDFWIRHIFEVADDIRHPRQSWNKHVSGGGFLENMKLQLLRAIKVHIFLLGPLIGLQRCLILFSRFCCFLTEKCFFVDKIRLLPIVEADPDFASFEQALERVEMPGETPQYLLAASVEALKKTKEFMENGRTEGMRSERLIQLLRTHSTHDNSEGEQFLQILEDRLSRDVRFEYLTVLSWKMTALSLIQLLLELEGHGKSVVLVDAYSQAYDFLDLLDNPAGSDKDMLPELFVRAADKQFVHIQQHLENTAPKETGTPQEPHQKVTELIRNAIRNTSNINSNDSVNWWEIAANNSLEKVCTIVLGLVQRSLPDVTAASSSSAIRSETEDATALTYKVRRLLADILAIALKKKAGKALVDNCRNWAKELEDEKIMASVYIAGKLSGVMGEVNRVTQREPSDGDIAVRNVGVLRIGR